MARTSSAGLPHLTCRPDAGQFTYHRSFRSGIVPFLKGELRPSWSRSTVALDGRQVIKVSLGTGDRRLAVTRWDELHPLVQAAVREAAARTAERDRVLPERLAPEAVRAMAGQVLHTVLADHDLTYIDPGPSAVMRAASLDTLLAWSLKPENLGAKRLSRPTINAKAIGALSVVMRCAKTLGFVQTNPCSDQALDTKKGDAKKRKAYSLADLKRIFSCGAFAPRPRITKGGCGPAAFWLPMLALFAGARLEELGQLLIEDVRRSDGIDYLVGTDLPDGNEQEDDEDVTGQGKSVKTAAGRRRIPIHSELKRLGFLAFVARRRAAGYLRLFPELEYYRDRCTKNGSRYWARLSDRHVTDRDDKAFHSFRHTFTRMLRNRKVAETIIKALVGHADAGDVTTGYGGDDEGFIIDLEVLSDAIETISIPELDLSHLIGRSDALGW